MWIVSYEGGTREGENRGWGKEKDFVGEREREREKGWEREKNGLLTLYILSPKLPLCPSPKAFGSYTVKRHYSLNF